MSKNIGFFAVLMFIIGAIDSIRNLPATALFGASLIFFFIFSAITFLIPTALVSAELAARNPNEGGIYFWVKNVFGKKMGFLAVWLQWINTMIWYPTMLSFIASTAVYLIDPKLAQDKYYLISIILLVFWALTYINLKGIQISAELNSFCAMIGTVIPMVLIIVLGCIWAAASKPMQIHFSVNDIFPTFGHSQNWISLTAIITTFLGMELTAVHVNNIKNAQKIYPKAVTVGAFIVLITLLFGSLAIAVVLPEKDINLVDGTLQAFGAFFKAYHLTWMVPVMTILILIGSFGGMINWIISPAKGLLQAAQDDFLPHFLAKKNEKGVAKNLLILQAVLVSLVCLAFLLMPSVNGSYWLLTDLSTQIYVLMYMLMFLAAIVTRYKFKSQTPAFMIPGGNVGMWIISVLGLVGCCIAFVVGFFPPDGINVGGVLHYEKIFTMGIIGMVLPVLLFYFYQSFAVKKG